MLLGLLDANTVRLRDPQQLSPVPATTAISLAELSVGPLVATTEHERAARQAPCIRRRPTSSRSRSMRRPRAFGQVAADLRRSGRKTSALAYDVLISPP